MLSTGEDVTIEKVEAETLTETETTYNFEVADFHTYYGTGKDVLGHNTCRLDPQDIYKILSASIFQVPIRVKVWMI